MTAPVLDISDLQVEFPGLVRNVTILRGVNLCVNAGDVLGLVGESGSGKSMTAMACLGIVPSPGIVSGHVLVGGQEVVGRPDRELEKVRGGKAAMIFQNPLRSLNPYFTVGQQMIEIIRRHRPYSEAEAYAAAQKQLQSVQIPDPDITLGKYSHQLSGGQVQRVMIALALACQPALLIADEPTTALDVTIQAQIISLLRELADKSGLTVLFITHDLGVVSSLCNRVAVMYAGKIIEQGSVGEVINNPRHPYTAKLMNTVPVIGRGLQELETIPGQVPNPASLSATGCAFYNRCEFATKTCSETTPKIRSLDATHQVACHHVDEFNNAEQ